MTLSQEEIDACHEAFREIDVARRGHIDVWELRVVLQGRRPSQSTRAWLARRPRVPHWEPVKQYRLSRPDAAVA